MTHDEAPARHLSISCSCGASINVPDVLAGHQGRCPGCDGVLRVPLPPIVRRAGLATAPVDENPDDLDPRDAFRVVRVDCPCGREVAVPLRQLRAGKARCPSCDRYLPSEQPAP